MVSTKLVTTKRRPKSEPLVFTKAVTEIADALNVKNDAAAMTLYGLCATGNIRWLGEGGEVIDEDECTIADFNHKPRWVIASDVRSFLTDWSPDPQPSHRHAVIKAKLDEGARPGRTIPWKKFCNEVRDKCNGWRAKGKPTWGFSNKQIQRHVKDLMDK
jgi:hypothetical protein